MVDVGGAVAATAAQLALTGAVVRAILRNPALRRVELAFLLFNTVEYATWIAILIYAYDAIGPASVGLVAVVQLIPRPSSRRSPRVLPTGCQDDGCCSSATSRRSSRSG
jgi:hypothetical protein